MALRTGMWALATAMTLALSVVPTPASLGATGAAQTVSGALPTPGSDVTVTTTTVPAVVPIHLPRPVVAYTLGYLPLLLSNGVVVTEAENGGGRSGQSPPPVHGIQALTEQGKVLWEYVLPFTPDNTSQPVWTDGSILVTYSGNANQAGPQVAMLSPAGVRTAGGRAPQAVSPIANFWSTPYGYLTVGGHVDPSTGDNVPTLILAHGADVFWQEPVLLAGRPIAPTYDGTAGGFLVVSTGLRSGQAMTYGISPTTGETVWSATTQMPRGWVQEGAIAAGSYVVYRGVRLGTNTAESEEAVAVQSAANGKTLWAGVLPGTVIDTTHGYHGDLVTNGTDIFGCSAPWAVGAGAGIKPVCRAYSLATGQIVQKFTVPAVSSKVVLNPLAASPAWLLLSAEVGPWQCWEKTGEPLNVCRPEGSRIIAVPLRDPTQPVHLPGWGVLQDTFNFSPTDAVTIVSPYAMVKW